MTGFGLLPPLPRALFALWALLLCLTAIVCAVLATVRKRLRLLLPGIVLILLPYFLWQVIFNLSQFAQTDDAASVSRFLGSQPWLVWLFVFALLSAACVLLLVRNLRYDKTCITPGTIKHFLDLIPCGICCWQDNGRVLFSNVCMNRLCLALTGEPLLNGEQFRVAAASGLLPAEGRMWRFTCRELLLNGRRLHEMIASDISGEYAKTQALERDKAELSALNRELREYYQGIDEIIRRQELLRARVRIHDEMNRLMLLTMAAGREGQAALDHIFSLWEQNALLLCRQAEEDSDMKETDSLNKLAAAMGIQLIWQGGLPEQLSQQQRSLFRSAAQEAVINAVKHAQAGAMTISFSETEAELCCRFSNDGKPAAGPVRFTGGLANLSTLARQQGAAISVDAEGSFALILRFPKAREISHSADVSAHCS